MSRPGGLKAIAPFAVLGMIAFATFVFVVRPTAKPAAAVMPDGRTPQTAIVGRAFQEKPMRSHLRSLSDAHIMWIPENEIGDRCVVVVDLPPHSYVYVPSDWCEGMR